jgi:serine kinase of HPr protein (carbohydrate metabolism regulator)
MTPIQLAEALDLKIVSRGDGDKRTANGVFCCDLLSIVMGKAKADAIWITVMSNINTIAVAVLADVSCVILSEGYAADENMVKKAEEQGICLLQSSLPTFELGLAIHNLLQL